MLGGNRRQFRERNSRGYAGRVTLEVEFWVAYVVY